LSETPCLSSIAYGDVIRVLDGVRATTSLKAGAAVRRYIPAERFASRARIAGRFAWSRAACAGARPESDLSDRLGGCWNLPRQHSAGGRQRFSIDGAGKITLDPGESLVVSVDRDDSVSIGVGDDSEPPNGNGVDPQSAGARTRPAHRGFLARRQKMNVATSPDGTVTITPDEGNQLLVLGDPAMGEVDIVGRRDAAITMAVIARAGVEPGAAS
jgi:hypothetical protein